MECCSSLICFLTLQKPTVPKGVIWDFEIKIGRPCKPYPLNNLQREPLTVEAMYVIVTIIYKWSCFLANVWTSLEQVEFYNTSVKCLDLSETILS